MADTVKRLNYYDHQFLRVPDFTDEQNYNLSMRRLHNSALHTWGIVRGLGVVATSGGTGTAVTVSAGFALDSTGREIILAADTNLELGGVAAGTTLYITIAYDEQPSDPPTDGGGSERTRITEAPKLSFSATAPADASVTLILARVPRVGTNGLGTVDGSDRRQAGVVLGNDITVTTLTLKNGGVAQANWPVLSCSAVNQVNLASAGLTVNGTLHATGAVRFDSTFSYGDNSSRTEARDNAGLQGNAGAQSGFFQTENPTNYPSGATSWWHLLDVRHTNPTNNYALQIAGSLFDQDLYFRKTNNSASTAWNKFIYANSAGNVGIGTPTPTLGKLQTAGVVGSTAAVFAGDGQGVSLVANWPNIGFNSYYNGGWKAINTGYGGAVGVDQNDGGLFLSTADKVTGQGTAHVQQERMRLSNAGNVGIGTKTPAKPLDVAGSGGIRISQTASANAANEIFFQDNGQIRSLDDSHRIIFDRTNNLLELREYGDLVFSPGATSGTRTDRLRITSVGKMVSPMWRVTHVMNQRIGPLLPNNNFNAPFPSGGGTLMIIFSGSGFGNGTIGMTLQIDGNTVATTRCYTNETGSHKAFTTNVLVQANIAAGNHTISLGALAGTSTDLNDYFNVTVLELPF